VILLFTVGLYSWSFTRDRILIYTQSPYETFISPDGQFSLAVYDLLINFFIKTDDNIGFIILRDKEGNILNSCVVERIGCIRDPYWADKNTDGLGKAYVYINSILDWNLPKKKDNSSK